MRWFLLSMALFASGAQATITAKAYIVEDMEGHVILEQSADDVRSIASITKLVTIRRASDLPPDELITIERADLLAGHMRTTPLRIGHSYSRSVLINLALVSSDNVAAIALGRTCTDIVIPPNFTVVEPSGLNPGNQTSARALAEFARSLYNTTMAAESVQSMVEVNGLTRTSTNPLLEKPGWVFYLSKTGFINAAGGCLVVITQVKDQLLTIVILGSRDTHQRWRDLIELRQQLDDGTFYNTIVEARKKHRHQRAHP